MGELTQRFRDAVSRGDRAFVPFLVAGFPDIETSEAAIRAVADSGADAIEIGIPFSDSLADGPVVQGAYHAALARGLKLEEVFAMLHRVIAPGFPPVVLMTAYNLVFHMGLERFADLAAGCGVAGILPPDLPAEEWPPLASVLAERRIDGIRLVAPTTPPDRLGLVLDGAGGFVYYISRKGVTGEQSSLPAELLDRVRDVRSRTSLPVAVGFGVSTPEQAAAIGRAAHGVVVGSALVRALVSGGVEAVRELSSRLRHGLRDIGPLEA